MDTNKSSRNPIGIFLKGFLMGGADIIPGVSGGTMALIAGIYERLIAAISGVFAFIASIIRLDRKEISRSFEAIDWRLLIPLGLGIGSAIFLLAHVIHYFLDTYPVECRGLFFGLIAASVAIPWMRTRSMGIRGTGIAVAAGLFALFASSLTPQEIPNPNAFQIFGGAAVAICAMILPGVSGAFLLLVLGLYAPTTEAVKSLDFAYIALFAAGAATGMGLFSRLLQWLLNYRHDMTMAALVGLMAGSLRALWPWQGEDRSLHLPGSEDQVLIVAGLALFGFAVVTSLVWWEKRRQEQTQMTS